MGAADHDVIVAGTGPAGLAAALAFAQAGFAVALIGPPPNEADRRTTAIMQPALDFLAALGIGEELRDAAAPLETMRIVDATRRLLRAPSVAFHAADIGRRHFGLNVPNADLVRILARHLAAHSAITRYETMVAGWTLGEGAARAMLQDGTEVSGALVAAADGRGSQARAAAGISLSERPTGQVALALSFGHVRHHENVSTEFHTEQGPFTQVPLPGGQRSSLVWVVRRGEADRLTALDLDALSRRIETSMQSMLGRIEVEHPPQTFELVSARPQAIARRRVALLGEAAHVLPPIGAQGLNLGLRDVRDLVDVASRHRGDPGSAAALSAYAAKRRLDVGMRAASVDLLNRSLLSNALPAQIARTGMMEVLRRFSPARAFLMHEGMEPGSGLPALARSLRPRNPIRREDSRS